MNIPSIVRMTNEEVECVLRSYASSTTRGNAYRLNKLANEVSLRGTKALSSTVYSKGMRLLRIAICGYATLTDFAEQENNF